MAAATALLGFSDSVWILLVSRILQGFSAAIVWTVGLALTVDTVGKDQLAQWMGTALSSSSVGLVISPLLGGVVYAKGGLWGVLGMMIGLIALNIVLIGLLIEKRTARQYMTSEMAGTQEVEQGGKSQPQTQASYETFAPRDMHIHHAQNPDSETTPLTQKPPSSPSACPSPALTTTTTTTTPPLLTLLRSPRILASTYGVFTQFGLLASFDAFLPLFVQRRFGWDALGAGLIFLCIAVPALTGPLAGRLADRFGNRNVALAGCLLGAPPLLGLRWVGYAEGGSGIEQIVLLGALLALIGLFLTLIISPLAADLSHAVDALALARPGIFGAQTAYATAYSLFNMAMAAATVVGPVLAGAIQERAGVRVVAMVLAVWCASAAVPVAVWLGGEEGKVVEDEEGYAGRVPEVGEERR